MKAFMSNGRSGRRSWGQCPCQREDFNCASPLADTGTLTLTWSTGAGLPSHWQTWMYTNSFRNSRPTFGSFWNTHFLHAFIHVFMERRPMLNADKPSVGIWRGQPLVEASPWHPHVKTSKRLACIRKLTRVSADNLTRSLALIW